VTEEQGSSEQTANGGKGTTFFGFVLFIGLLALLVLLVKGLYPVDLPIDKNPDFIDNVFDNRAVIWAARLLLVSAAAVLAFGGIFIVASTVIRMRNKEWLRRAGPFEISETAVSEIEGQVEFWRDAALAGQEEVAELTERINESDELIEHLQNMLDDG
jgi:tetrahydromethanopterin S-methyltransferase subunit B